jgi:adenylate kinase
LQEHNGDYVRVILLGCPGAGKGTQAKLLCEHLNIPQISTGDMLRAAIRSGSDLGCEVEAIMSAGELVSDEIVMALVGNRLQCEDCLGGYLFDGFPRTLAQADAMVQQNIAIDFVINIHIDDDVIVRRMAGRRVHPGSGRSYHVDFNPPQLVDVDDVTGEALIMRKDDSEEVVRNRLTVYHKQTKPLVSYYQKNSEGVEYCEVAGAGAVMDVNEQILVALGREA